MTGCIHTYPEGYHENTYHQKTVDTHICLHFPVGSAAYNLLLKDQDINKSTVRITVELIKNNKRAYHRIFKDVEINGKTGTVGIDLGKVEIGGNCRLVVFSDIIRSPKEELYDVADLASIVIKTEPGYKDSYSESLYGTEDILLVNTEDGSVSVELQMQPLTCLLSVETNDYEDFTEENAQNISGDERFYIRVDYLSDIFSRFDLHLETPFNPENERKFVTDLPITNFPQNSLEIAHDSFFVPFHGTEIAFKLTVLNSIGIPLSQTVCRSANLIPGKNVVRGQFLTNYTQHFMNIDKNWEDEIIIDINPK